MYNVYIVIYRKIGLNSSSRVEQQKEPSFVKDLEKQIEPNFVNDLEQNHLIIPTLQNNSIETSTANVTPLGKNFHCIKLH